MRRAWPAGPLHRVEADLRGQHPGGDEGDVEGGGVVHVLLSRRPPGVEQFGDHQNRLRARVPGLLPLWGDLGAREGEHRREHAVQVHVKGA